MKSSHEVSKIDVRSKHTLLGIDAVAVPQIVVLPDQAPPKLQGLAFEQHGRILDSERASEF